MTDSWTRVALGVVMSTVLWATPAHAAADGISSGPEAAALVGVTDLQAHGGSVSGSLVNKSGRVVRDVQLLIRYVWQWADERHPGTNNPGRSAFYTVPGDLSPGGSLSFSYEASPPLPRRSDGSFTTTVDVVGFAEVGD